MNKLLTIAIPTRNRCKYLIETIDSIIQQNLFESIEIVVCNNASSDDTFKEMQKYSSIQNIRYFENEKLLSIDDNMIKVATFVDTEYFLWLGDDDFILTDGLPKILKYIEEHKYDFILLNAMKVSENLEKRLGNTINIGKNIIYNSAKEFFCNHCFHMPFGTLIVKKELYNLVIKDNSRFKGTSHAYSGLVFDYLARKNKVEILVVSKPFIQLRQIEKTWKNNTTKIIFEEIPKWLLLNHSYRLEVKDILNKYTREQFKIRNLMRHRFKYQLHIRDFTAYTRLSSLSQKIKYLMVSIIPLFRK